MVLSKAEQLKLKEIADKYKVSFEEAKEIIDTMYGFMKEKTAELDFKSKKLSKEEFDSIETNFNVPCIGKLCANYNLYKRVNKIK